MHVRTRPFWSGQVRLGSCLVSLFLAYGCRISHGAACERISAKDAAKRDADADDAIRLVVFGRSAPELLARLPLRTICHNGSCRDWY